MKGRETRRGFSNFQSAAFQLRMDTTKPLQGGLGPGPLGYNYWNVYLRTEDPLETDVDPGARGDERKANLHHPANLKAAPVTRAIGSQEIKGARRWRKTWPYLGAARMWIRLHLEFATSEARGRRECPTT
ncbi:hypothetical protein Tco_0918450 [Tanacetum coccineum]